MENIYRVIGIVVIWIIIIAIAVSFIVLIVGCLWVLFKKYELLWEKLSYYFGATIKTEVLRAAYKLEIHYNTKRLAFKYRLRNIRMASRNNIVTKQ